MTYCDCAVRIKGPYTVVTDADLDDCTSTYCEEDPFMWVDKRGNWHALYHRMFDPIGPLDPNWGKVRYTTYPTGIY